MILTYEHNNNYMCSVIIRLSYCTKRGSHPSPISIWKISLQHCMCQQKEVCIVEKKTYQA